MITFKGKGNFSKTEYYFNKLLNIFDKDTLDKYGKQGIDALKNATPRDSGKTAESWYYNIVRTQDSVKIEWCNDNIEDGALIAVLIQYGHGTSTGAYVKGVDYINPTLKPVFDDISESLKRRL